MNMNKTREFIFGENFKHFIKLVNTWGSQFTNVSIMTAGWLNEVLKGNKGFKKVLTSKHMPSVQ